MLLEDEVAVIHGAGGAIGGALARAFAAAGARVHLAGRTRARLEATNATAPPVVGLLSSTATTSCVRPHRLVPKT